LPGSAYGEGKRVSEHMCIVHARQHAYEVKIARCFAFVGPHLPLDAHFAIGNFIRDALAEHPIHIAGDGTPLRSYLYASDLTVWLWTLLFQAPPARAYNVGSADDLSIAQLAATVATALGGKSVVTVAQCPDSLRPLSRYVPSVTRAQTELGLRSRVSLADAIQRTAHWQQSL
jgi:nucleoside-diphosphate-sugar epimerase